MRTHVVAVLTTAAVIAVAAAAAGQGAGVGAKLTIQEPVADSLLVGEVAFKAELSAPNWATASVQVFLDGAPAPVCRIEGPPYECLFKVGESITRHSIRAVATFADGTRVTATVATAGGVTASTEANAVLVPVVVTDYLGRFVKRLTRDSFTILEDGVAQPVTFVDAENVPLDIVVAVDMSGSMAPSLGRLKASVKGFLSSTNALSRTNANVRVTVLAFNDRTFVVAKPDATPAQRFAAVDGLKAFGGTAIFDAVLRSMDLLGTNASRKAVVVFTDGVDQSSLASPDPVMRRVRDADVTVYAIALGEEKELAPLRRTMGTLAEVSGGRAFPIEKVDQLDGALRYIVEDLSNQYLIGYSPINTRRDGAFRRITVRTNVNSHRIRAREGYRAAAR